MVDGKNIRKLLERTSLKGCKRVNSIEEYEAELYRAIVSCDGPNVSILLGCDMCHSPNIDDILAQRRRDTFRLPNLNWETLFQQHLQVLQRLRNAEYIEAYRVKHECVTAFVQIISESKEWALPLLRTFTRDLRQLSIKAEQDAFKRRLLRSERNENAGRQEERIPKPDFFYEQAADMLMVVFRACVVKGGLVVGAVTVANQLFNLYKRFDKLNLFMALIKAIEATEATRYCSKAQLVTFSYYDGVRSLLEYNPERAEKQLEVAYRDCHPNSVKNRYLCLIYLIPLKMLYGQMPSDQLLKKYNLMKHYQPIKKYVLSGHIDHLNDALEDNSRFFTRYGVQNVIERLRILCYRNLFKKVVLSLETHLIPIESLRIGLAMVSTLTRTDEDIICVLANLIHIGRIKGYISISQKKLVVSKIDPFPKIIK